MQPMTQSKYDVNSITYIFIYSREYTENDEQTHTNENKQSVN